MRDLDCFLLDPNLTFKAKRATTKIVRIMFKVTNMEEELKIDIQNEYATNQKHYDYLARELLRLLRKGTFVNGRKSI